MMKIITVKQMKEVQIMKSMKSMNKSMNKSIIKSMIKLLISISIIMILVSCGCITPVTSDEQIKSDNQINIPSYINTGVLPDHKVVTSPIKQVIPPIVTTNAYCKACEQTYIQTQIQTPLTVIQTPSNSIPSSINNINNINNDDQQMVVSTFQSEVKQNNLQWTPGITPLTNLSDDEKRARLGISVSQPVLTSSELAPQYTIQSTVQPPDSYDLRYTSSGDYTTPVKDQGGCSLCWAFATNAVVESALEKISNNANLNPDLSEWYLVEANNKKCNSLGYSSFQHYINAYGHDKVVGGVYESIWPYNVRTRISLGGAERIKVDAVRKGMYSTTYDNLKQLIYNYGSVYVHMKVYGSFYSYRSGIYSKLPNDGYYGLHAVQVIGYDTDPITKKAYLICKNSWGTGWGESGFFKIYTDQCGILSTYIYYIEYTTPDIPVPTPLPTPVPTVIPTLQPTPTPTVQPTPTPTLQPLIADFSVSKSRIKRYESVYFMDYSRGNPDSWAWFIGPNIAGKIPDATTKNVNYVFTKFGYFNVKLSIKRSSDNASSSVTKVRCVKVN